MGAITRFCLFGILVTLPAIAGAQYCTSYCDSVLQRCQLCNQYSGVATTWRNYGNYCLSCGTKGRQIMPIAPAGQSTVCQQVATADAKSGLYFELDVADEDVLKLAESNVVAASILAGLKYRGAGAIDPIDRRNGVVYFSAVPTKDSVKATLQGDYAEADRLSASLSPGEKLLGLFRTEFSRDGSITGIFLESAGSASSENRMVFIPLVAAPLRSVGVNGVQAKGLVLKVGDK